MGDLAHRHQLLELQPGSHGIFGNLQLPPLIDSTRHAHGVYKNTEVCKDLFLAFLQIFEPDEILLAKSRELLFQDTLKISSLLAGNCKGRYKR